MAEGELIRPQPEGQTLPKPQPQPQPQPGDRKVRAAMRTVVGDLENVLGELKTVVGDLRVLVSQIDVVTNKIDEEYKEDDLRKGQRRHSVSLTEKPRRDVTSSVPHSVSESLDLLRNQLEWVFHVPTDFVKPVFPEPESKATKSRHSSSSHSKSVGSSSDHVTSACCCKKQKVCKQSSREEVWYQGVARAQRHVCKTSHPPPPPPPPPPPVACPPTYLTGAWPEISQMDTSSDKSGKGSSSGSGSQGLGTLSSYVSLQPWHCSPCSPSPDADYCGVYERELEMRLELEFDDALECYTGIDESDTLELKAHRLSTTNDDADIDDEPNANVFRRRAKRRHASKEVSACETASDILNDNVKSRGQSPQSSVDNSSSNYGTYSTWEDSDSMESI